MIAYIKSNKDLSRNLPEESYIIQNIKNDSSLSIRNISGVSVSIERDSNNEQSRNLLSDYHEKNRSHSNNPNEKENDDDDNNNN